MAMTQQASSTTKEARSRKLLSLFMALVMAATLMIPQAAWADEPEGAPAQSEQDQTAPVEGTGDVATGTTAPEQPTQPEQQPAAPEQPQAPAPEQQQAVPEAEGEGGNVAAPVSTLEALDTLQVVGPVQSADPAKPDNEKKFYNVLYANGKNVVVEPATEGLKVTVDGTAYSFANNSASYFKGATDGLTIFAGGDSAATGDSSITVKGGAKVGAIFAGGNKADYAGTATVVVEEGAEAGTIYGGGLTPAGDKTGTAKTTASTVTVNGKAGIVYAGGMASVGPTINEVVTFSADKPAETTAKNFVGSSKVTINGEAACYFGGSYSYGGVGTVSCELNGTLTGSYSAIAGTNGFRGDASMTVGANGKITGLLYMSMRGYIGDTSLVNNGSIGVLTLLPDGANVSTYGNTDVVNAGTIARAHLDCGCGKEAVSGSAVTPYPETITVDGTVRIRTTTIDEKNGNVENTAKTSTLPEGTALSLLNGATYDGYSVMIGEKGYADFAAAAQAAQAGDTVTLTVDQTSEPVTFANNVTVDLGGHTLTIAGESAATAYGVQFAGEGENVLKNGTLLDERSNGNQTAGWKTVHVANKANLATQDVAIKAYKPDTAYNYNYLIYAGGKDDTNAKALSLGAGTELSNLDNASNTSETYGAVGISLIGTTTNAATVADKVKLTIAEGVSINTMGYAIAGNGTYHGTEITIDGGTITSTGSAAIYHPQAGTLTLNGGTLEGTTGIQFCSGEGTVNTEFQFNGGTVKGVGVDERAIKTGDGLVSDGSALSLVNRGYPGGTPSITINGGTFTSANNDAVLAYTWEKGAGDAYEATEWAQAAEKISITGGTYSSDVSAYVAEGYNCTQDDDAYTVAAKPMVAEIVGGDQFSSLAKAIDAAGPTDTVKLLDNITQSDGIEISKDVTIDLDGKTFTVTDGSNINNRGIKLLSGHLTITNGTMVAEGEPTGVQASDASSGTGLYGTLRLEGGTLDMESVTLKNGRPWGLNVKLSGAARANLTNVVIESEYGGGIEVAHPEAEAVLNDCAFTQKHYFDWTSTCVSVSNGGKAIVNGGTYVSDGWALYVFSSGGTLDVNDGTFQGAKGVLKADLDATSYPEGAVVVSLKGGDYTGAIGEGGNGTNKSIAITGGTYTEDPAAYVAEGYDCAEAEGKFHVSSHKVAQVGDTAYETLQAAFDAATEGKTVVLLDNVDLGATAATVATGATTNLDLAGKKVTGSAKQTVLVQGGLTITDSATSGTIENTNTSANAAVFVPGGKIVLEKGSINGATRGVWLFGPAASLSMTGGSVEGASKIGVQVSGKSGAETSAVISGGTVVGGKQSIAIYGCQGADDNTLPAASYPATVEITGNAVIESPNGGADLAEATVTVFGKGAVLEVSGGTVKHDSKFGAISGNGFAKNYGTSIAVSGGVIQATGPDGPAVYHPQVGELTITGGEISGATGVEMRAGTLYASDNATIQGSGEFSTKSNTNGGATNGVGIAVAQHITKQPVEVHVSAGTVSGGTYAFYEGNPEGNGAEDIAKVSLDIAGGSFSATSEEAGAEAVYSADCTGFITGGSYSSDVTAYCEGEYQCVQDGDVYKVSEKPKVAEVKGIQYANLDAAIVAAGDGDTVTMINDAVIDASQIKMNTKDDSPFYAEVDSKSITLDLAGRAITFDQSKCDITNRVTTADAFTDERGLIYIAAGAGLTVKDSGEGGIIKSTSPAGDTYSLLSLIQNYGVFTMESGTITGAERVYYLATMYGSASHTTIEGGTLDNQWGTETDGGICLSGNGTTTYAGYRLDITGGTLKGGEQTLYLPSAGTTNISGTPVLEGTGRAIEIRAGQLTIDGGTFTATAPRLQNATATSGGTGAYTGAIVAVKHKGTSDKAYKGAVNVTINGGTFTNANGDAIAAKNEIVDQAIAAANNIEFTIAGGYFSGGINNGNLVGPSAAQGVDKLSVSGGYFTADPSAYLAAKKVVLPSDTAGYPNMVAESKATTDAKPVVTEPTVTVDPDADLGDETAKQEIVDKVAETQVEGLNAYANEAAENLTQTTVDSAKEALKQEVSVGQTDTITVFVQTYVEIKPKAFVEDSASSTKALTVDITPKSRVVASTATDAKDIKTDNTAGDKNAVVVDEQTLNVTSSTVISVPLPSGFVNATTDPVFAKHLKSADLAYVYQAVVSGDATAGFAATFTNPNGFSEFTLTTADESVASIGGTNYTTLQAAVNAVTDGQTIKLLKNAAGATVSKAVSFTLDAGGFTPGDIVAGSGFVLAVENGLYTVTAVVPVTGVTLDKTNLELTEGGTATLVATVAPDNATDKRVTWTSSNEAAATVSASGVVTAVKAGTATITAKAGDKTATCAVTVNAKDVPKPPAQASRLGGADRYKTMALISQTAFPENGSCSTVIVARGDNFPDALAAAGLAGVTGGQVLLTETGTLTAETKAEIKRLGAQKAYVIGDTYSVTARTFNEIKAITGSAERLGGADRMDTALKIYQAGKGGWGTTAIVATGKKAADSLSVSPISYAAKAPIFLADNDGNLSAAALDAIAKGGFTKVLVLGDKYSVSNSAFNKVKALVSNTERIGGADRYETSRLTAQQALKNGFGCEVVSLTAGREGKYADALVASSLSGKSFSVLLLVDDGATTCIDKVLAPNKAQVENAYVLGDKYTVSNELFAAIEKAVK
ncbi:cell wall-binding repeat-containing protein [Raoultibacter phocaeensis]|uniref:cell wall-binding repeat-containing protein n=1 Tax=Raoultibacter phocaeensis TaxID=2479841 RepID=UPI0011186ACB|nr:cell wall-binding repeat-containing protein [Raoultibacter phocaeensis]